MFQVNISSVGRANLRGFSMIILCVYLIYTQIGWADSADAGKVIAQYGDNRKVTMEDIALWAELRCVPEPSAESEWIGFAAKQIVLGEAAIGRLAREYPQEAEQVGIIKPYVQRHYAVQLLRKAWLREFQPSEEEVRKAYEEYLSTFSREPKLTFDHIFLDTHRITDANELKKVENRANEILRRLRAGESFADLAKQYSDAESAAQGGRSGPIPLGKISKRIEEYILCLKDGEISDVFAGKYGFQIFRRVSLAPNPVPTFEEKRETLARACSRSKAWQREKTLIEQAAGSEPTFDRDFLNALRETLPWGSETMGLDTEPDDHLIRFLQREWILRTEADQSGFSNSPEVLKRTALWAGSECLRRYLQETLPPVEVTEDEIADFIRSHPDRLMSPEQVHLAIIKVFDRIGEASSPAEIRLAREATQDRLNEALKRIQAGEEFADVARDISEDPSAENGGDIGTTPVDRLGHTIAKVQLGLKDGETSRVVRGPDYGLILHQIATIPAQRLPENEAQTAAKNQFIGQKRRESTRTIQDKMLNDMKFQLVN